MAYLEQKHFRQTEDFDGSSFPIPELFLNGNRHQWLIAQDYWEVFLAQNSESGFAPARARSAILYAENLGSPQYPSSETNGDGHHVEKEELVRDLMTDTVGLTAWETLFRHHYGDKARFGSWSRYSMLYDVVAQRQRVKTNIESFDRYFRNEPIPFVYGGLLTIFNNAQAIVSGHNLLSEADIVQARRLLTGLLAEHKVVKGLRSVWPATRHATIPEERRKIDAVVSTNGSAGSGILLQVKSRYVPNSIMTINPRPRFLEVNVPMNPANNNPLRLSPKQRDILIQAVEQQLV